MGSDKDVLDSSLEVNTVQRGCACGTKLIANLLLGVFPHIRVLLLIYSIFLKIASLPIVSRSLNNIPIRHVNMSVSSLDPFSQQRIIRIHVSFTESLNHDIVVTRHIHFEFNIFDCMDIDIIFSEIEYVSHHVKAFNELIVTSFD